MTPLKSSTLLRASGESDAALKTRQDALARLEDFAMPSGREELWRYVDLDFDLNEFDVAPAPDSSVEISPASDAAGTAMVVDGAVLAAESTDPNVAIDRALGSFESLIAADQDIFTATHAAYGAERVDIVFADGKAVEAPVIIDVWTTSAAASFPAVRIRVGDGAEATVAIRLRSADDLTALVVPHVEGSVGDNANLTVVVDQGWGRATRSIGQMVFEVGRDSSITTAEAGLGASLARWQLDIKLAGQGSNARVLGAYFGDEDQVLDYRYVMHHAAPNTHSEMFLKGAVEDEAGSVFTGMIRIDEIAQRTDAFQTNRNLILSEGASAQSVPNLEILANDVKCGHASTVGQLDPEQRYYLMSRGLDKPSADRLQVRGFFEEALSRFPVPAIVEPLRDRFNEKFLRAQEEGRL